MATFCPFTYDVVYNEMRSEKIEKYYFALLQSSKRILR